MRAVDAPSGAGAKRPTSELTVRYDEHTMTISEICDVYGTHVNQTAPEFSNGLTNGEAANRLMANGSNDLTPPKQSSNLKIFLLQFTDTFMILLELVAFLSLLSWSLEDPRNPTDLYIGLFLVFVILAQSFWMYKQETHSAMLMEKFRTLAPQFCICIREGNQLRIRSEALVVGDLIKLTSGSKIPADCRLVKIFSNDVFKVDQSSITGESEPVNCCCTASRESSAFDAYNIVFGGSLVVEGEALGVVIRSGDKTLLGHTARMTGGYEKKLSTLQADVDAFVYTVAKIAIAMGIFVFLLGFLRGMPLFESLMDGLIVTIIANVPCGLPATVTACLLIVAQRMINQNVFVKKLDSIETLGACSLICTDKTGTLTQNCMRVSHTWFAEEDVKHKIGSYSTTLFDIDKFKAACSAVHPAPTQQDDSLSSEAGRYRILSNGMSDLTAGAMLLKVATLNSRISLTNSSAPKRSPAPQQQPMMMMPPQSHGAPMNPYALPPPPQMYGQMQMQVPHPGGFMPPPPHMQYMDGSNHSMMDTSVGSHALMMDVSGRSSAPSVELPPTPRPRPGEVTGDATETGIYHFAKDVTSHCHRVNVLASGNVHLINSLSSVTSENAGAGGNRMESIRRELTKEGRSGLAFPTSNVEHVRQWHEKVYEIPFNSSYKWQMSIHDAGLGVRNISTDESHQPSPEFMTLKGAPDVLLPKCSHYLTTCEGGLGHKIVRIDRNFTNTVNKVFEQMASHGERALAFAMKYMHKTLDEFEETDPTYKEKLKDSLVGNSKLTIEKNLIFVGLVSLIDPPRPEVPKAIAKCKSSGVKVVMVTGDYPATALYIARKIGLFTHPTRSEIAIQRGVKESVIAEEEVKAITVHGSMIENMTPEDWNIVTKKEQIVFARTTPEQKLTIVKHFIADGHVVAMTGDGVNDSSALKHASIGVCMGRTGSDIAREAADIILLDDNFASIVVAIQEGRLLFDNLKKSVAYTLSHLIPEVLPVLLHFGMGLPLGLPAVLALSLDLITEVLPAAAMAFETPEADIMNRPPRDVKKDRLTGMPVLFYSYCVIGVIEAAACLYIYFEAFKSYGLMPSFIVNYSHQFFKDDADYIVIVSEDPNELDLEFSPDDQMTILHHVQSTYFLAIIVMQILHAFEVRARTTPIFQRGVLGNVRLIVSCLGSVLIGGLLIYGHGSGANYLETEEPIKSVLFVGALGGAAVIYLYNEIRKQYLIFKAKERQATTESTRSRLDIALSLSESRRGGSSNGRADNRSVPQPSVKRPVKSFWERLLQW